MAFGFRIRNLKRALPAHDRTKYMGLLGRFADQGRVLGRMRGEGSVPAS
jgi:hypothetical protein